MRLMELTHHNGNKVIVNLDKYERIDSANPGSVLTPASDTGDLYVLEKYDRILDAIIHAMPDAPIITISKD